MEKTSRRRVRRLIANGGFQESVREGYAGRIRARVCNFSPVPPTMYQVLGSNSNILNCIQRRGSTLSEALKTVTDILGLDCGLSVLRASSFVLDQTVDDLRHALQVCVWGSCVCCATLAPCEYSSQRDLKFLLDCQERKWGAPNICLLLWAPLCWYPATGGGYWI